MSNAKYLVLEKDMILNNCTDEEIAIIEKVIDLSQTIRISEGKEPVESFIVISADRPIYKKVRDFVYKLDQE